MVTLGAMAEGQRVPITLGDVSTVGADSKKICEFDLALSRSLDRNEEALAVQMISEELRREGVDVRGIEVSKDSARVQVSGQSLWVVVGLLPQILSAIGIVLIIVATYFITSSIPTWLYVVGGVGLLLVFIVPYFSEKWSKSVFDQRNRIHREDTKG